MDRDELPRELREVLARFRELEAAAGANRRQRRAVGRASGTVLLAAREAGWPPGMLGAQLGVTTDTVTVRTNAARERRADGQAAGLVAVPARPPPPEPPEPPLDEKPWLTGPEVARLLDVYPLTVTNWRLRGLFPHVTTSPGGGYYLYPRTDVIRLIHARVPYYGRGVYAAATRPRLAAMDLTDETHDEKAEVIVALREQGCTWPGIAAFLGISVGAPHDAATRRFESTGRTPGSVSGSSTWIG